MLAYRSASRRTSPSALVDEIAALATAARASASGDLWTECLIACGELETAVTDAVSVEHDELSPLTRVLSDLTLAAAERALASSDGDTVPSSDDAVTRALPSIRALLADVVLPAELEVGIPEGFAYYGLYPETYAAAARALVDENDAARIVCIGIRSIGTTLAAVVAATIRHTGRDVALHTVRPRGHPFDRVLSLGSALLDALATEAMRGAVFAVVDEGPGLSGTSFASVADTLSAMGVGDERIVLLPSWDPAAERLRSLRAQSRWRRHRKVYRSFEQMFDSCSLLGIARRTGILAYRVENVAAGTWRGIVFDDERDWPAVQPQHERRKYLVRDGNGAPLALLKFEGLGRYGRAAEQRARALANGGLSPRVIGSSRGFVATEWVSGEAAREGEADPDLLEAIARHVAHLATTTRTSSTVAMDELLEIVRVNVGEALGPDLAVRLVGALERFRPHIERVRRCAVDGRMLPHEWIRAETGWIKVDGTDHHDDHFLPGDQDPAWDLVGATVELLLDHDQSALLVDAYVRRTGDDDAPARLPFLHAVYLATRLGYVTLAAEGMGATADAERMRALARRYTAMLRRAAVALGAAELAPLPDEWSDVRAIVFDADETLRRTTVPGQPCPHAPNEWRLRSWAADGALASLAWGDQFALGAASNQDHVGYGHLSERQARALLRSMLVEATGVAPARDVVQLCPHVLEEQCDCRKPGDGMLRRLLAHFGIAPDALLFVGDAATDADAALRAGVRFAHVDEFAESLVAARNGAEPALVTASAA